MSSNSVHRPGVRKDFASPDLDDGDGLLPRLSQAVGAVAAVRQYRNGHSFPHGHDPGSKDLLRTVAKRGAKRYCRSNAAIRMADPERVKSTHCRPWLLARKKLEIVDPAERLMVPSPRTASRNQV